MTIEQTKAKLKSLRRWWCRKTHNAAMVPVRGKWTCRKCQEEWKAVYR